MHTTKKLLAGLATVFIGFGSAMAQSATTTADAKLNFPTKPVRLVVPFPAGGTVDGVARTLGPELAAAIGQSVVIENRGGAGGSIGAGLVAQAQPDGHTLLLVLDTHAINPLVYKTLSYDTDKDFAPISLIARAPMVAVATNNFPANDIQELIEYAKKKPDHVNYASVGAGSASHLTAELFNQAAGVSMVHIPYKGGSQAMTDLIGGQVEIQWGTVPYVQAMVKSGKLKALGQTGETRSQVFPELKTVSEQGLGGIDAYGWVGLLAPAGTPPEILVYWHDTLKKVVNSAAVSNRLTSEGFDVMLNTPEEFRKFVNDEQGKWNRLIQERQIQLQ